MCKRQVKEYTLHTRRHTLTLSDVSSKVVLMFCPWWNQDIRDRARRKLVDCLTTQCFRFCSVTPEKTPSSPPLRIFKVGRSTLHWSVLGWTVPSDSRWEGWWGAGSHKNTEKKRGAGGANRWQHTARSKERYVLVKNKHVWCLSGALQQKGGEKKKCLFFLLLFKLVAQKQQITFTSHLLAPCTWVRIL